VIACNDLIAIGFIRTVLKAGCRMPEDVQGIGFDNILMRPY
jgi:DNA-binding LacI/PurR family transcriptional regulator